jgi:hypothetical protein
MVSAGAPPIAIANLPADPWQTLGTPDLTVDLVALDELGCPSSFQTGFRYL